MLEQNNTCVPDAPGAQEQFPLSGNTMHKNIRDHPSEKEEQNCWHETVKTFIAQVHERAHPKDGAA